MHVGLYLGGEQVDLDESTTKRILIATYDMAEEAFDCIKYINFINT